MEQQDQFQVELILAERTIPRGDRLVTQYKVKWKGYSANESTWEPIENLENCLHLLEAYQEKLKKKSEPKPPKASGNPKKAAAKDKVNASREVLPKESAVQSSNDFYFEDEDENEALNIVQNQPSKMEVEPAQEDAPQSASKEVTKPKSKVKQVAAEENQVKVPNKRGRKKKKTQEVLNVGSIDQLNITYEQLGQRAAEEQLNYEPTKRVVKVNNDAEERWNSFTQTEPIIDIKTDMEIITMHTSYEYPGKVWFTVREFGKLMEITRSTLLEAYPRVLYTYYHKHYLMAKQRSLDLMRKTQQNFVSKHVNLIESNQESNSIQVSSEPVSSQGSEDSEDYIYINEMQKKERISHKRWKKEMKEKLSGNKRMTVSEGSEEDQNDNQGK